MLSNYFQLGPIPANAMYGTYDWHLVLLSYLVASFASYVVLDMAGRLRDDNNTFAGTLCWLLGGSFAMGAGMWSMNFIGMLAFQTPMPMGLNRLWTMVSMGVAILASLIALSLLIGQTVRWMHLAIGGFFLGIAIAAMHYTGMYAMTDSMIIRYIPSYFFLSILIAIIAAEAALWLAIKSNHGTLSTKIRLKIVSALILGAAICGMHYTGMYAAIFYPKPDASTIAGILDPNMLATIIAVVTFLILGVAFALSTYREITNQQLITTARLAGMAEVSSNVLHSVGNVLNSLNVSAYSIGEHIEHTKITQIKDLNELIQKNKHNLGEFFTKDPKGINIPDYIQALSEYWKGEQKNLLAEIQSILTHIQHIKDIISTQQSLKNFSVLEQMIDIRTVINEAITITGLTLSKHTIRVNREFEITRPHLLDKIKLLQILVNLLGNAKDALFACSEQENIISIHLKYLDQKMLIIRVIDNGIGIKPENLKRIFTHGFTTKDSGHGFGLHSSAILAKQMGGSLNAESPGEGQGATFTLVLLAR